MLLSDEVTNFTELLVEEIIDASGLEQRLDNDTLPDVLCLTLNKLPPHYVRSTLDVKLNLSAEQRTERLRDVDAALVAAVGVNTAQRRTNIRG